MKGISLPVNVIVIVSIAVIVLLGISAFYMSGMGGATGTKSHQDAFNKACRQIQTKGTGCAGNATTIQTAAGNTIQGYGHSMLYACEQLYGYNTDKDNDKAACIRKCCPSYTAP